MRSNPFNTIEEAIEDLKKGKMVIVCDDEDRENEGDLIMCADLVKPEDINFMAKEGRGLICMPVNHEIADRLNLKKNVSNHHGLSHCNFTDSIDAIENVTTGTSAHDRAETIQKAVNPLSSGREFSSPGHVFPVLAKQGGVLVRAGHTEAATDLAEMAGLNPAGVICEIMCDDGTMARLPDLTKFAEKHSLKMITIADLIEYRVQRENLIKKEADANMPTKFGNWTINVYSNNIDKSEHVALIHGDVNCDDVLLRVHSECLTGDAFSSIRCDCQSQLHKAMKTIQDNGSGVIIYMRQEGRGIGLTNKIKAYNLQDRGYDTVEANKMLGFEPDLRTYGIGAQIIRDLGIKTIKLLTNNPKKVVGLEGYGLKISGTVALETTPLKENAAYLKTKKQKMGHNLNNI